MGRCTRTIGERRLSRTIYKLGNSVEFSSKEGKAKISEEIVKQKDFDPESVVQNIRDPVNWKKKQTK